jgi:hypothetical protein
LQPCGLGSEGQQQKQIFTAVGLCNIPHGQFFLQPDVYSEKAREGNIGRDCCQHQSILPEHSGAR